MTLFNAVHDVLGGAMDCFYQDAVYIEVGHPRINDFADAGDCPETEHPCKVQIDTNSRGQRADSSVSTRGGMFKVLTQSLDVIPKAQDKIRYTPIGDPEHTFTIIALVETDPANVYYKVAVER